MSAEKKPYPMKGAAFLCENKFLLADHEDLE